MITHSYSIETLIHYQCGNPSCNEYWSKGDADPTLPVHCPSCGVKGGTKEMEPLKPKAKDVCEWRSHNNSDAFSTECGMLLRKPRMFSHCPCGKPISIKGV